MGHLKIYLLIWFSFAIFLRFDLELSTYNDDEEEEGKEEERNIIVMDRLWPFNLFSTHPHQNLILLTFLILVILTDDILLGFQFVFSS